MILTSSDLRALANLMDRLQKNEPIKFGAVYEHYQEYSLELDGCAELGLNIDGQIVKLEAADIEEQRSYERETTEETLEEKQSNVRKVQHVKSVSKPRNTKTASGSKNKR